jgi:hypothetical protein
MERTRGYKKALETKSQRSLCRRRNRCDGREIGGYAKIVVVATLASNGLGWILQRPKVIAY